MRLPDFTQSDSFNSLRKRMFGASLGDFEAITSGGLRLSRAEHKTLETKGIDVDSLDEIQVLEDGTLAYKDSRVLVHIRDISQEPSLARWIDDQRLPRFHVANCSTLQEMRRNSRFGRYVVATRDDGLFIIRFLGKFSKSHGAEHEKRLIVCQNCLSSLSFEGFAYSLARDKRKGIVRSFTLKKFFEAYPKSPIRNKPVHTDITSPVNKYAVNHKDIAIAFKNGVGWKCDDCEADLSEPALRPFLHLHHINGLKNDNRDENFEALCIECHSNRPSHGHIRGMPEYGRFIELKANGYK